MRKTIFLFFMIIAGSLLGDTTWVSDTICAVWDSAGSPYIITGDVEVPAGDSLIIGPGAEVLFSGYFSIHIRDSALFKALGTETDSILFDVYDTASGYYGVYLLSAQTCSLAFCRIQNADCGRYRGAITLDHTPFFISNSFFTQNRSDWGSSICIKSNDLSDTSIIQNSLFISDSLYSIFLGNTRNLTVLNCIFDSNYGALLTGYPSRYNHIVNCTFVNNKSDRVISMSYDDGATLCINNSIFDNPLSQYATYPDDYHCYFDFSNSLINPRKCRWLYDWYYDRSEFYSWSNCIYTNPQFIENSYELSSNSLCIDSGCDTVCCLGYSGYNTMQIPDFDYYGNPREQGNGIDLGAIESPYSIENHRPNIVIYPRDTTIQLPITVRDHLWITELDGDSVTIEFINAPGAYIENDSFFVWEPTSTDAGTTEVTVIASDGELADTASFTYVIWSHSPQFMYYPPNWTIAPGDTFRDYIYAYDPDGETLDYHYKMPLGAEVIGDTQIVWIPEVGGEYWFKVKACDPYTCAQCSFQVFVGTQVSGEVCGVWSKEENPYYITGDVEIIPGCSLIVNSGVNVVFPDDFGIYADSGSVLIVNGSNLDSVTLVPSSDGVFKGISLENADSCRIKYLHLAGATKNMGAGIAAYKTRLIISNSLIEGCHAVSGGGGIYAESSYVKIQETTIFNCSSSWNKGGGVYLYSCFGSINNSIMTFNDAGLGSAGGGLAIWCSSNIIVESSKFSHNFAHCNEGEVGSSGGNGGGLMISESDNITVFNSLVNYNSAMGGGGGGVCLQRNRCKIRFVNCTVIYNSIYNCFQLTSRGAGVYVTDTSMFFNTVLAGNKKGRYIEPNAYGDLILVNCLVDTSLGLNDVDTVNVFFAPPYFSDTLGHLSDSSSCIDAGAEFIVFESETIWAPTEDIDGNARPCSLGWDIGCYEFYPDTSSDTTTPPPKPETFHLSIHPNPFNSAVHISSHSESKVEIFDILGRLITKIPGGEYIWKPEDKIGSGVYLVRSTFEDKTIEKKVIYLK